MFAHPEVLSSDLYISDYTNYKGEAPAHGVDIETSTLEIHKVWPPLHIHNPHNIPILVANMERNPSLNKRKDGKQCKQCECICISQHSEEGDKPWFALVELKCCTDEERNIETNIQGAITKLKEHPCSFKRLKRCYC